MHANIKTVFSFFTLLLVWACRNPQPPEQAIETLPDIAYPHEMDTPVAEIEIDTVPIETDSAVYAPVTITPDDVQLSEELLFDKYTLDDEYQYNKTTRSFQWSKMKEYLALIENLQHEIGTYAVLQNYRNINGKAPLVKKHSLNKYQRVADSLGVERNQSIPLFEVDASSPSLYARDGSLVRLLSSDTVGMATVDGISFEGLWFVPQRYVKPLGDSLHIRHVVFVDVTNQNIALVEKIDKEWKIRSKNPATTGKYKPPYSQVTPTGIFVLQEKRGKMFYFKDGTTELEGFAPYACRFTNGAHIHGVPVANPTGSIVEYSSSLGTTPRSHMCVRNASSHAQFIYQSIKALRSLVIVID